MLSRRSLALVLSVVLWTVTAATAEEEGTPQKTSDQPAIRERGSGKSAPTAQRDDTLGEVVVVAPPARRPRRARCVARRGSGRPRLDRRRCRRGRGGGSRGAPASPRVGRLPRR